LRRSPFKVSFLAAAAVVPALVDVGCTSSSSTTSLDPPHLTASITALGVTSGTPGGPQTCDQIAAVNVGPNDGAGHLLSPSKPPVSWTIAPPLTCIGTPPCGFLELAVYSCLSSDPATCSTDPDQVIDAAGPSITVTVASMTDPAIPFDHFYRFHVALFNPDATPAVDRSGKPYPADVIHEVNAPCAPPAPPEPDAAPPPRDASPDVSVPPKDATPPPPPDAPPPKPDATTPVDASPMHDSALPPPDALPPQPDASAPRDAGRLPDAQTP
jgi:hypothetical protein